jgi:hypothetical protein
MVDDVMPLLLDLNMALSWGRAWDGSSTECFADESGSDGGREVAKRRAGGGRAWEAAQSSCRKHDAEAEIRSRHRFRQAHSCCFYFCLIPHFNKIPLMYLPIAMLA